MTARRFLVAAPPEGGTALLDPELSRYAVKVLRLRSGQEVVLFDGAGREWTGTVERADRRGTRVAVGEARAAPPPAPPRILLATSVPKGKRMGTLLAMATEAGVDGVVPVDCARSTVRGSGESRVAHWRRTMAEASRQCGRAWLPVLEEETPLGSFLARPPAPGQVRLRATTAGAPPPLLALRERVAAAPAVVLLVGPEGGFLPEEEEGADAAGFLPCSLGPLVLRVETAGVVAVGLVRGAAAARSI